VGVVEDTIFHITRLEPLSDQFPGREVADQGHQLVVVDVVERSLDVCVENPAPVPLGGSQVVDPLDGIMLAATGPKPVGAILDTRLPVRLKTVFDHRLKGAVHDSRDTERPLPAVSLRDVDPPCRERLPRLELAEPVHQPPTGCRGFEDDLVHPRRVLPSVGLRHPAHRHDAALVAAKHDPLEGANLFKVAFSRSSEDFLTELANKLGGLSPVNGVPVARALRRAYGYLFAWLLHRRAPQ